MSFLDIGKTYGWPVTYIIIDLQDESFAPDITLLD